MNLRILDGHSLFWRTVPGLPMFGRTGPRLPMPGEMGPGLPMDLRILEELRMPGEMTGPPLGFVCEWFLRRILGRFID